MKRGRSCQRLTSQGGKLLPPNTLLWPLEPHTEGKHRVLRHYLDAWLPIMMSSNQTVRFIDAFAGPGKYTGGEDGSPLIALDAYLSHQNIPGRSGRIDFIFIEKDGGRAKHLESVLSPRQAELPDTCSFQVINGSFTDEMTGAFNAIETQNLTMAPAFAMIDPFGVSDTPMDLIARILDHQKSEVYISFMSRDINRFNTVPEYESALDELFGCPDWRHGWEMANGPDKIEFFYELYERQLRAAGARYVLRFDLFEQDALVYALFFATKNDVGCDKMKQAMWRVAPFGDFQFKSAMRDQMILDPSFANLSEIDRVLPEKFGMNVDASIAKLEQFMRSDETLFHSGQLKSRLREMEKIGTLEVVRNTRRGQRGFPEGTILRFVDPPPPQPEQRSMFG